MGLLGAIWGDTPEIERFETFLISIEDELDGEDAGGVSAGARGGLGALEVVTGGFVVKNEAGGENWALGGRGGIW